MEETTCPLCTEEFDATDLLLASRLCQCRFAVCLWCYRRLTEDAEKESRPALCPNCRDPYETDRIAREGQELDPQQLEEVKRKKGRQDGRKGSASAKPRKDLANVRVVQRNLVYIVGLPMECCFEEVLMSQEYIGQFGKIVKISVSRTGPYGSTQAKNGPTGSAYVTFKRDEDARRCIESIHSTLWEGKLVKACYGTTKYCNAFLKGLVCNNADCLYLHDVAVEEDSYTKEETKTSKFVNLVHAASLNQPGVLSSTQPSATSVEQLSQAYSGFEHGDMEDDLTDSQGWPSLSNNAWGGKPQSNLFGSQQSIPQTDDIQAWPGLPGGAESASGHATTNPPSSAEVSENEAESTQTRLPASRQGATMAVKLARASSGKDNSREKELPKKLTPLPSRHKSQASHDGTSSLLRPTDHREPGRLSPPPTPQLSSSKLPQKLVSPDHDELHEHNLRDTAASQTEGPSKFSEPGKSSEGSGFLAQPPPGFADSIGGSKSVTPPPGFADVPLTTKFLAQPPAVSIPGAPGFPIQSSAQQIWDNPSSFGSNSRLYAPSEARSMSLGSSSQRSQSRFTFAQGEDMSESSNHFHETQPRHDYFSAFAPPAGSQSPFISMFGGGIFGGNSSLYNTHPLPHHVASQAQKFEARDGETLPAGLALLKRLQAQGGVARAKPEVPAVSSSSFESSMFSDPAAISSMPQIPRQEGQSVQDGQHAPKTPPRRRKSKS